MQEQATEMQKKKWQSSRQIWRVGRPNVLTMMMLSTPSTTILQVIAAKITASTLWRRQNVKILIMKRG